MKTLRLILTFIVLHSCIYGLNASSGNYPARKQEKATEALVGRIIPEHAGKFQVKITGMQKDGKDYFAVYGKGRKIVLEGTDGVSAASALNLYLKDYCNCQVGWCGTNLDLPEELPVPEKRIEKTSPHKYRYYLNYCTFNYTMSWWDKDRWQREIDLMALNGINTPLALTGQNSVWQRVYRKLGFSDKDLESFFSGPTHFSWFWMGNIDGWGGPLPQNFIDFHEDLQKYILEAERSLGMTPVLPAFTGHVPPAFSEKFPDAKVRKTSWVGFPEVSILDPDDSLFTVIGEMFMEEQTKLYGTDHLYSADTFNENIPPTNDPAYLAGMSRKVYESMSNYDPEAIWIMQGWLFYFSGHFWKEPEIKALLEAVPDDKMMILDLWSDRIPVWKRTDAYYGKPWLWCMLHNFGQNSTFNGDISNVAKGPAETLRDTAARNIQGIGLTMEGIEQMPLMYALMHENVWRDTPVDLNGFISSWLKCRYGSCPAEAGKAWQLLAGSVFEQSVSGGGHESVVSARPSLTPGTHRVSEHRINNYVKPLNQAWDLMIKTAKTGKCDFTDGFRYDIVDITRQVLAEYANALHTDICAAYKDGNHEKAEELSAAFIGLLEDMDTVVGTRSEFLLGRWIRDAKAIATCEKEAEQYEFNARNLVTLWGGKDCGIHDYACRHWNGLIGNFYKGRWDRLFEAMKKEGFDQETFNREIRDWEWQWGLGHEVYPAEPSGDEVEECLRVYEKYSGAVAR